jgi:hypothetical protein
MRDATAGVNGTHLDCNCAPDATGLDMRALAVSPGQMNSGRLLEVPEPPLAALAKADHAWLSRLITRQVPLTDWPQAFVRQPHDIKVIIDFDECA